MNTIAIILGWALATPGSIYDKAASQVAPMVTPPLGRVLVVQEAQGYQVRTSQRTILRGGTVAAYKFQRDENLNGYLTSVLHWRRMRVEAGLNAIRLVAFDPWQRSHGDPNADIPYPYADFLNQPDLTVLLQEMDNIVARATLNNMYVMINYHDVGNYRDPDHTRPANAAGEFRYRNSISICRRFWRAVAARYKDKPNVFFELTNEPCAWFPANYTAVDLANFKSLYDDIRLIAPQTHIVFCSFANTRTIDNVSMLDIARGLRTLGVDFSNASIGFHPYNSWYPEANQRTEIDQLRKEFPVINTEQNFPKGVLAGSSDPDGSGFDGDVLGVQSMERMRISWFHWNCTTQDEFLLNFLGKVVPDARSKQYFWVR